MTSRPSVPKIVSSEAVPFVSTLAPGGLAGAAWSAAGPSVQVAGAEPSLPTRGAVEALLARYEPGSSTTGS